jgi:uncharacterized RDD family membrane protein YckC
MPQQPAQDPSGQQPGQGDYGQGGYGQGGYGEGGYRQMEVPIAETKVTGRRVVQYIIDYILAGIIPGVAYWLFDRGSGTLHGIGWFVATVISLAVYFVYWVAIPHGHRGQTFGMRLFGIHVISKDGSKATMMQLFLRGIFLIIDTLIFGLVGFITILCSKYRQRIGDHVAKTVVTPARFGAQD